MFAVLVLSSLIFNEFVVNDKPGKAVPAAAQAETSGTASAASDTLQACLSDICTLLPTLAEDPDQLTRNGVAFKQQDDADTMLTRANAEIHCTYAEELFEQGRTRAAIKIMTKVSLSASVHPAHLNRLCDKQF